MEQKKDLTKKLIAESFQSLLEKHPFDKITIRMITDQAGLIRPTFYNHFQDKYDLVNWYFDKILLESFEHMGEGETIYEGLVKKFQYIQKEKLFFKMAFKSDDQNCLRDHDFELILAFYSDRIQEKSGKPLSEDLKFLLEMYCQGSIYMTVQWVFGRVKRTPEELAADLVKAMPEELAGGFERLNLL